MGTSLAETDATSRYHPALHIDVLADGQRIIDVLLDDRRRVSVGRSRRNTVVLPDPSAPRSLPLFHRRGDGYALHYTDETHGSVAREPGAPWRDLDELHDASLDHRHGFDLALDVGARGRVEVGDETLLFWVVSRPDRHLRLWWPAIATLFVLATLGLLVWAATRHSAPSSPPAMGAPAAATAALPRPASPAPAVVAAAAPTVYQLPPVRLTASSPAQRSTSRPRSEIDPTGVRRERSPSLAPAPATVPTLPRGEELALGSPSYTSDGLLRPEVVLRELGIDKGAIHAAYERELRTHPDLAGDIVARIAIERDGSVGNVSIVSDTVGSPALRRRVQSRLSAWHAPLPTAARAEYEVPFHFRPAHATHRR